MSNCIKHDTYCIYRVLFAMAFNRNTSNTFHLSSFHPSIFWPSAMAWGSQRSFKSSTWITPLPQQKWHQAPCMVVSFIKQIAITVYSRCILVWFTTQRVKDFSVTKAVNKQWSWLTFFGQKPEKQKHLKPHQQKKVTLHTAFATCSEMMTGHGLHPSNQRVLSLLDVACYESRTVYVWLCGF